MILLISIDFMGNRLDVASLYIGCRNYIMLMYHHVIDLICFYIKYKLSRYIYIYMYIYIYISICVLAMCM